MITNPASPGQLTLDSFRFYRHAFDLLRASPVPFLIGGAYAFGAYTGINRHTKDLDLFVRPADARRTLDVFRAAGYRTEMIFTHWLAKVYHDYDFIDVIFSSGNGQCPVDDVWFARAVEGEVLGTAAPLVPVEEMIWQKAYIMERERFDGADVNHLLRARGRLLDWDHLLGRFGPHWRVLLAHLILFGFVYPEDRDNVPPRVLRTLTDRLRDETDDGYRGEPLCRGTLLSRVQYLTDVEGGDSRDPRLVPLGSMTEEQVTRWTDAGR